MKKSVQIEIAGYALTEEIHSSSQNSVYRGIREQDQKTIIAKVMNQEYPSTEEIARFQREYQMTKRLDLPGVIATYSIEKVSNRLAIILEDFGGQPLLSWSSFEVPIPLPIDLFFRIAIKIAAILGDIHRHQIIHKDIQPQNILINPQTEEVKIIDFGIATELSREERDFNIVNLLEGSLPYISPEQTGRINRHVDYLTDYYSLGATFYHLLTGSYPFEAKDLMGWVYCHITQLPSNPHQINEEIPEMLSEIILKLMAKNTEDRYQSAHGLIKDLEMCQSQWQMMKQVVPFILGQSDTSDNFQIPQKLYGREEEIKTLMNTFQEVSNGNSQLLLVSGSSGVGKTVLVKEVQKPIVQRKGYFIEGKFDQFQRDISYSAIIEAFQSLAKQLSTEPDERLKLWKNELTKALGPNGQIILDLIPEMEKIIGKQAPIQQLNPKEAENRFLHTFYDFVKVFAQEGHPLVIFLDDLQWSDIPTQRLIQNLFSHRKNIFLFVIGAYRNHKVSEGHPLLITLDKIQKSRSIRRLFLRSLEEESVNQILADCFHCSLEEALPLAKLIFQKTKGNPFFLNEFLKNLYQEKYLNFIHEQNRWGWELEKIKELEVSDNVVDFMINRLKKLPTKTQEVLKLASCIGNRFDLKTLSVIYQQTPSVTAKHLWEAAQLEIILPLDEQYRLIQAQVEEDEKELPEEKDRKEQEQKEMGKEQSDFGVSYKFQHARIQQAVYSLLKEKQKREIHLLIGQIILQKSTKENREELLVEIVSHFNIGRILLKNQEECKELAELNLAAAQKSKSSIAYTSAYQYLKIGMSLLPESPWEKEYSLTFSLMKEYAECAYLCGNFEDAEENSLTLLKHARTKLEKAEIFRMQMQQYTISGKLEDALQTGFRALSVFGIKFAIKPSKISIAKEVLLAKWNLGKRRVADLVNQPPIQDPEKKICKKLIMELGPSAYLLGYDNLFALLSLKAVNISLRHGNTPESAMAFVTYGFLLGVVLGDFKTGYEFGKLGIKLNEQFGDLELRCRIIFMYTVFIQSWNRHWKTLSTNLKRSLEAGYQSGDLFYMAYACVQITPWDPEINLESAIHQGQKYLYLIEEAKYQDAWSIAKLLQQTRLNLSGAMQETFTLTDESFDEMECLEKMEKEGLQAGLAVYHLCKLQICYYYQDYQSAVAHVKKGDQVIQSLFGLPYTVLFCFYSFLSYTALYPKIPSQEQGKAWKRIKREFNQMKKWADHCPENFQHLFDLMQAEVANLTGKHHEAGERYLHAIKTSKKNEFLRYEAIANELAAKFYHQQKQDKIAAVYFKDAIYCYQRWGAQAKVNDLSRNYPNLTLVDQRLFPESIPADQTLHSSMIPTTSQSQVLDLSSVIRATQTLSGEVVLEKLLEKLVYIMRENAGAEKGFLILKEKVSQSWLIQAESIHHQGIQVMRSQPLEENEQLSRRIVQYVARSQENVVLGNAAVEGEFIKDLYIQKNETKSVLCTSILNQGKQVGILYLENNVTTHAFTPSHLEVLGILSTQAAISIENAVLYQTMEGKVIERTRSIQDLLDNAGQGFLSFDENYSIHKEYSKTCEVFFSHLIHEGHPTLEGLNVIEVLEPRTEEQSNAKQFFDFVFSGATGLETIREFLPQEISLNEKILAIDYKRIKASNSDKTKDKIMAILTDVTKEKKLAKRLKADEKRNNIILRIVKNREAFLTFLKETRRHFETIDHTLAENLDLAKMQELFRYYHTIKGGAANFSITDIVEQAHNLESFMNDQLAEEEEKIPATLQEELITKTAQLRERFFHFLDKFKKFIPEEDLESTERTYLVPQSKIDAHCLQLVQNFGPESQHQVQQLVNQLCKQPIRQTLRNYEMAAQSIADKLGKLVDIKISGEQTQVSYEKLEPVLGSLIHLIRNSIDHGIEHANIRKMRNKKTVGKLGISAREQDGYLEIEIQDDGAGIDKDELLKIALNKKLISEEWKETASHQDMLNLIFLPGFSTKQEVSEISGRGVGMDAVKAAVEEQSGSIQITSKMGKGSTFLIHLPIETT